MTQVTYRGGYSGADESVFGLEQLGEGAGQRCSLTMGTQRPLEKGKGGPRQSIPYIFGCPLLKRLHWFVCQSQAGEMQLNYP